MIKKLLISSAVAVTFFMNAQSQNVVLDTNFGNIGKVIIPIPGESINNDLQKFNDGSYLVLESKHESPGESIYVTKYSTNGQLDSSFGNSGVLYLPHTSGVDYNDYTISIGPGNTFYVLSTLSISRYLSTGQPDTSFSNGGNLTLGFTENNLQVIRLITLSDGSLVGAYTYSDAGANKSKLFKVNSLGIDSSFGSGGSVVLDGSISDFFEHNNQYYVVSNKFNNPNYNYYITTFTSNGVLNTSFGANGSLQFDGWVSSYPISNNIIVEKEVSAQNYNQLLKYSSQGVLDTSFGTNGIFTLPIGVYINEIKEDSKKNLVLAGSIEVSRGDEDGDVYLSRLLPNGQLDLNFNATGFYIDPDITLEVVQRMVLLNDNELVGEGYSVSNGTSNPFLIKYQLTNNLATNEVKKNEIAIFPNPVVNEFEIKNRSSEKIELVKIFDASGKKVFESNQSKNSINHLASGVYFVEVKIQNKVFKSKLIKK